MPKMTSLMILAVSSLVLTARTVLMAPSVPVNAARSPGVAAAAATDRGLATKVAPAPVTIGMDAAVRDWTLYSCS